VRGRHFESQRGRANTGCANRESSGGSTLMPMAWRRRRVQARRGASGSPTASAAAARPFPPRKSGEERRGEERRETEVDRKFWAEALNGLSLAILFPFLLDLPHNALPFFFRPRYCYSIS
jgi:hypothetical protein